MPLHFGLSHRPLAFRTTFLYLYNRYAYWKKDGIKHEASYWNWTGSRGPKMPGAGPMVAWCNHFKAGGAGDELIARCFTKIDYHSFTWTDEGGQADCFDATNQRTRLNIWSTAMHEFGHWLELEHSSVSDAVMVKDFQPCTPDYKVNTRFLLTTDDKNGIKAIYP